MVWCYHEWEATGADSYTASSYDFFTRENRVHRIFTVVLKRCKKCTKTKTEELPGVWTLEQVRGSGK